MRSRSHTSEAPYNLPDILARLGRTAAGGTWKLLFQMNIGAKAARVVPIGGPTRDT